MTAANSAEQPLGEVRVRVANEDDTDALARFLQPFVESGRVLERTLEELDELVRNGFVAEEHGQIVGCAALDVYSRKLAEIRSLAVAEARQQAGVGRQLVQACVERARQLGVREVMAITSAEEFFRRCGFDFTLPGEKKALFIQPQD